MLSLTMYAQQLSHTYSGADYWQAYYWTTIPKNRSSYHPSRGVREDEITKIIQSELIINKDLDMAERKLLATDGLRKFSSGLKTDKDKADFKAHLRRYMLMYLPDCPFEVNSTNRYTIVSQEAAVTARRFIRRNETIKYLAGTQVTITPEEEREMTARKKDFSIIVSSRSKCASLFMGPARFANHDCKANARLVTTGQAGIEVIATTNIDVGEEITVTYAENYFGVDNCECLCVTCEKNQANGWAGEGGEASVKMSIEDAPEGYSLRRRRRDDSIDRSSRTPSVTPDIRPRVSKSRPTRRSSLAHISGTIDVSSLSPRSAKKRPFSSSIMTPPVTPAKKLKLSGSQPTPLENESSRGNSVQSMQSLSSVSGDNDSSTDITEPEKESPGPTAPSLKPRRDSAKIPNLKQEASEQSASNVLGGVNPYSLSSGPVTVHHSFAARAASPKASRDLMSITAVCNPVSPPASQEIVAPTVEPVVDPAPVVTRVEAAAQEPKNKRKYQKRRFVKETTPPARHREPGDYTLTPLLLSEPEMAWIRCINCDTAFVQHNAYYTKSSCPRCERHSKLHGYIWPKTEREGPRDKEERVLDHRTIHRFLGNDDEAKIRGRKRTATATEPTSNSTEPHAAKKQKQSEKPGVADQDAGDVPARRSGRVRRVSSRIADM